MITLSAIKRGNKITKQIARDTEVKNIIKETRLYNNEKMVRTSLMNKSMNLT